MEETEFNPNPIFVGKSDVLKTISQAGGMVTRQELIKTLYPSIDERSAYDALNQHVRQIRRDFNKRKWPKDMEGNEQYLYTVPRYGYLVLDEPKDLGDTVKLPIWESLKYPQIADYASTAIVKQNESGDTKDLILPFTPHELWLLKLISDNDGPIAIQAILERGKQEDVFYTGTHAQVKQMINKKLENMHPPKYSIVRHTGKMYKLIERDV